MRRLRILLIAIAVVSCATNEVKDSIDLRALDGFWQGGFESTHVGAGEVACGFKGPIAFEVKKAKATNVISSPIFQFETTIRNDGFINFSYKKILTATPYLMRDGPGDQYDIEFS